jgi:hypothetical protein
MIAITKQCVDNLGLQLKLHFTFSYSITATITHNGQQDQSPEEGVDPNAPRPADNHDY